MSDRGFGGGFDDGFDRGRLRRLVINQRRNQTT
jgi:hypothetical protein